MDRGHGRGRGSRRRVSEYARPVYDQLREHPKLLLVSHRGGQFLVRGRPRPIRQPKPRPKDRHTPDRLCGRPGDPGLLRGGMTMRRLSGLCCCLCLASCSSKDYGDHPPYPVSGQVLVNGQPANGARVVFHHLDGWGEKSIVPQAVTGEDGRFVLSTYGTGDGAPAGDYRVVVAWPAYRRGRNVGPDRLMGKFAKP